MAAFDFGRYIRVNTDTPDIHRRQIAVAQLLNSGDLRVSEGCYQPVIWWKIRCCDRMCRIPIDCYWWIRQEKRLSRARQLHKHFGGRWQQTNTRICDRQKRKNKIETIWVVVLVWIAMKRKRWMGHRWMCRDRRQVRLNKCVAIEKCAKF